MYKYITKLSKFDRILVSPHFTSKWPNANLLALPIELSDHCPLVLKSHSMDYGPIPFKLFNSWLLDSDFPTIVSRSWLSPVESLNPTVNIHPATLVRKKLQLLKCNIKIWRNNSCGLSTVEVEERISLIKQVDYADHIISLDLLQKAKIKWPSEGDKNSKFFHGIVNNKFARSRISGIFIDGVWVIDPSLVIVNIFTFYKDKFHVSLPSRPHFTSNLFKTLTSNISLLDAPFTCEEIKRAVRNCGSGKASGPDGFTFKFIKLYWETIGKDFVEMVKRFEADGFISRAMEALHVSLEEAKSKNIFEGVKVGLLTGANTNKACNWKPMIEKFHKRLSSWKARTLSYG
nr:hypothetical protein [Tanacetum cinerariifolium]